MPGNYNKIVLVGNLTRDPEQRFLSGGSGVTKFSLAVNRKTKTEMETMYVDIVAWDKLGDICNQYLKKGASVLIEGRLAIRKYDDKDGVKKTAVEIVASDMQMLGSKSEGSGSSHDSTTSHRDSYSGGGGSHSGSSTYGTEIDEEIPF